MGKHGLTAYVKVDGREILPDELRQYADHFNLFQHRILTRRWQYQADQSGRFTVLKRSYIDDELGWRAAAKLIAWGEESGYLQRDGNFVIGEKSLGYRLGRGLED